MSRLVNEIANEEILLRIPQSPGIRDGLTTGR
jgi:hypothetical protein